MADLFQAGTSETYVTYQLNVREDLKIRYSSTYKMGETNRTNFDPHICVEFIVSGEQKYIYLSMAEFDALYKAVTAIDNLIVNTENNTHQSRI